MQTLTAQQLLAKTTRSETLVICHPCWIRHCRGSRGRCHLFSSGKEASDRESGKDTSWRIRPNQEGNMGLYVMVSKSRGRFPSSTLKFAQNHYVSGARDLQSSVDVLCSMLSGSFKYRRQIWFVSKSDLFAYPNILNQPSRLTAHIIHCKWSELIRVSVWQPVNKSYSHRLL